MIALMKRILAVAGNYKKRIYLAFIFSFLKSLLAKAPLMLAFMALAQFYEGTGRPGRLSLVRYCNACLPCIPDTLPSYCRPAAVGGRV